MLHVADLVYDVTMPDHNLNEEDLRLVIVVQDYEGKLHHLHAENIQHDYNEGQLILEMFDEVKSD